VSDEPLLSVRDVSLRFGGVAALDSVSFDIIEGQIVGLIGPNGAGKTSLFNCISRLYQPTAGSIRFEERELLKLRPHHVDPPGHRAYVQNVALFGRMSVLDNVLVGDHHRIGSGAVARPCSCPRRGVPERQARRARARSAGRRLTCDRTARRFAQACRSPFKKRVELARALVSQPRLLLLDEPAAGSITPSARTGRADQAHPGGLPDDRAAGRTHMNWS